MFEHSGRRNRLRRSLDAVRAVLARYVPRVERDDAWAGRKFTRRALLLGAGQAGLITLLAGKLHELQVTYSKRYRLLADDNRLHVQAIATRRGGIRDRAGRILAESREDLQVSVIPDLVDDLPALMNRLGRIIELSGQDRQRVLETAAGQSRLTPVLVRGGLTWEEFSRINLFAPELPGIEAQIGWTRVHSDTLDAGPVVGYVGKADRFEVDKDPTLRLPDQRTGKAGVELGMEPVLRGKTGIVRSEVDARGSIIRVLERVPAVPGRDIELTIDTGFQSWIRRRLRGEEHTGLVVMHLPTGEIVGMGSTPGYDTSLFADGINATDWRKLVEAPGDPLVNKAVRGLYPPGSTFKMVTALAGLEAEVITPDTRIMCRGLLEYGGHRFRCWSSGGHGSVNLHRAISESCDVYFYETARRLGIDRLAAAGRVMGFGQIHECGIASVKPGIMPDAEWKKTHLLRPWLGGETLLAGIGQGYVLATPLHLALMTARVASGRMIKPVLVRPEPGAALASPARLPFKEEWLAAVRRGMIAAVNSSSGTAKSAAMSSVVLAGKTGTSQVSRASAGGAHEDLKRALRDHSLFVCYAPAEDPLFAVAAIVEHGGGGSKAAAPMARDIMAAALSWSFAGFRVHDATTASPNREARLGEPPGGRSWL